jgi:hypothetical protein
MSRLLRHQWLPLDKHALVAAALLGVAISPVALAVPRDQAPGAALVAGQVVDATSRQPVAGAVVTLGSVASPPGAANPPSGGAPGAAAARRAVAITGAQGRFVIRDVPAGTYTLTATSNGYAPGATGRRRPGGPTRTFTVSERARITDAVIPMWRYAAISGTVRDDRGEPVIGVSVWAMRRISAGGRLELSLTGGVSEFTDDRGYFHLGNLVPGSYYVGVRSTPQSVPVSTVARYRAAVTSGRAGPILREWTETSAIRVVADGLVVDGWQVSVPVNDPHPLPGPSGAVLISPTTFFGNARSPAEATVIALGAGDHRENADFTLPLVTSTRVSGVLTGPAGPAANHGIQLFAAAQADPSFPLAVAYSTTDDAGRFSLLGVTPGTYIVRARRVPATGPTTAPPAAGALPSGEPALAAPAAGSTTPALFAEGTVTVGSSPVDGVSLVLQPGIRLSGRVVFDGVIAAPTTAQLQRISISVRPLAGSSTFPGAGGDSRVSTNGTFQTAAYAPGRYFISATSPAPGWTLASATVNGVDASDQSIALESLTSTDVVVTFTDKAPLLTGAVRLPDSGTAAEATIVAYPADVRSWVAAGMSPRRVATAMTGDSGAYQLALSAPGEYFVVAIPPELAPEVDPEFVARFGPSAIRVSVARGETRSQALTVSRVR